MQLLFEEFFKKVYGYSKGKTNSLFLIITIRLMIYIFLIGFVILIAYLIYLGSYKLLAIIIGLVIVGEGAHFLRKSREKVAYKKAPKDASMEHAAEMLKTGKSKNTKLLGNKSMNKNLLKSSKPKNKKLLSNKKP